MTCDIPVSGLSIDSGWLEQTITDTCSNRMYTKSEVDDIIGSKEAYIRSELYNKADLDDLLCRFEELDSRLKILEQNSCKVGEQDNMAGLISAINIGDTSYTISDKANREDLNDLKEKLSDILGVDLNKEKGEFMGKFKIGDKVTVKKIGDRGSEFVQWNSRGQMDRFDGVTAFVENIDVKPTSLFNPEPKLVYTLTGVKGIGKWDFGEDNLVKYKPTAKEHAMSLYGIKSIVFDKDNNATIVKFEDGSKELAICQPGDTFDEEKGLMVCLLKHFAGSGFIDLLHHDEPKKKKQNKRVKQLMN